MSDIGSSIMGFGSPCHGNYYLADQFVGYFTPQRFGGKPDSGDVTDAISQAISACKSLGRGVIHLSPGQWTIDGQLLVNSSNIVISGSGIGVTQLYISQTNNNLFTVGDGSSNPNNVTICNMSILVSNQSTSGSIFTVKNSHGFRLEKIRTDGKIWKVAVLDGGKDQFDYRISDFEFNCSGDSGSAITVGSSSGVVQDVFISKGTISGFKGGGIMNIWVSGMYANNLDIMSSKFGIGIYPEMGMQCVGSIYSDVLCDTSTESGLVINPQGGLVGDTVFNGLWASTNGSSGQHHGINVNGSAGTVNNLTFNAPICTNNKGNGIFITQATGVSISSPLCASNSMIGISQKHGIEIASGTSRVNINGGVSGKSQKLGFNNQDYGVMIDSGSTSDVVISGTDVNGNVSGGVANGSTGGEVYVRNCPGFKNESKGTAKISSGSSQTTINPNLDCDFSAIDISISPTSNLSGVSCWAEKSGDYFIVKTSSPVNGDKWVSWKVKV